MAAYSHSAIRRRRWRSRASTTGSLSAWPNRQLPNRPP